MKRFQLGPGAVMGAAAFLSRTTVIAVLHQFSVVEGGPPDRLEVVRTRDGGEHWEPIPTAPPGVVGVQFVTPRDGWAWTDRRLFSTHDFGETWTELAIPEGEFPRDGPLPVVNSGALWVVLYPEGGGYSAHNKILRVSAAGDVDVARSDASLHLRELTTHGGDLWALTNTAEGVVASDLYRIEGDAPHEIVRVATLPIGLPVYLAVHDDGIIAGLVEPLEDGAHTFLVRSADGGRTWSRGRNLFGSSPEAFCSSSARSVWVFGKLGTVGTVDY